MAVQKTWFEDFPFRESRTYVHSTTLCNYLATRFPTAQRLELVLRRWMNSRVVFSVIDKPDATAPGQASLLIDGSVLLLRLDEDPAFPVQSRDSYDENAACGDAAMVDGYLVCNSGDGGTFFDRLIAANKMLINVVLDPKVKLIATKIMIEGLPADAAPFRLKLESHVGTRIFKSSLWIGQSRVGEVIFYGD